MHVPTHIPSTAPSVVLLSVVGARERAGCFAEAMAGYEAAIAAAEASGSQATVAEALRRLAVLAYRRGESVRARELCHRSYGVARAIGHDLLAAEARNTLGGLDLASGSLEDARTEFLEALELGGPSRELRARVEQTSASSPTSKASSTKP